MNIIKFIIDSWNYCFEEDYIIIYIIGLLSTLIVVALIAIAIIEWNISAKLLRALAFSAIIPLLVCVNLPICKIKLWHILQLSFTMNGSHTLQSMW